MINDQELIDNLRNKNYNIYNISYKNNETIEFQNLNSIIRTFIIEYNHFEIYTTKFVKFSEIYEDLELSKYYDNDNIEANKMLNKIMDINVDYVLFFKNKNKVLESYGDFKHNLYLTSYSDWLEFANNDTIIYVRSDINLFDMMENAELLADHELCYMYIESNILKKETIDYIRKHVQQNKSQVYFGDYELCVDEYKNVDSFHDGNILISLVY